MVIYGEYLFLENFILGFLIAFFSGEFAGTRNSWKREAVCGFFCGISSFLYFFQIRGPAGFGLKILLTVFLSWIGMGGRGMKRILCNSLLFLLVTVFFGGIAIAILNLAGWQGITGLHGVYIPFYAYLAVTATGVLSSLVVAVCLHFVRTKRRQVHTEVKAEIRVGDQRWILDGFIDSGNFLKDPLTGKPVILGKRAAVYRLLPEEQERLRRYRLIPYRSVGVKKGVLEGYRIDSLTVEGQMIRSPILAIMENRKEETLILPECLLERGIYAELEGNQ